MKRFLPILLVAILAVAFTSCGDPKTIIEPHANHVAYEYSYAEVENAGGLLAIDDLIEGAGVENTPGVVVWGMGNDADGDFWYRIASDRYSFTSGQLEIDYLGAPSDFYRIVIGKISYEL